MATPRIPNFRCVCPDCGAVRMGWHSKDMTRRCVACKGNAFKWRGATRTKLFGVYNAMRQRCGHFSVKPVNARWYADKGVYVCEEWRDDFGAFATWANANGYAEGLELDRLDSDGPYSPENCRWISGVENRRRMDYSNRKRALTKEEAARAGEMRLAGAGYTAIAKEFGVSHPTIRNHILAYFESIIRAQR